MDELYQHNSLQTPFQIIWTFSNGGLAKDHSKVLRSFDIHVTVVGELDGVVEGEVDGKVEGAVDGGEEGEELGDS